MKCWVHTVNLLRSCWVTCPKPVVCLFRAISVNSCFNHFSIQYRNVIDFLPFGRTAKMCWLSHASPPVQMNVSIDVSGLPDQENSNSPSEIRYFLPSAVFVYFVFFVTPALSSAILMTGNVSGSSVKCMFLYAAPFTHWA